MPKRGQVDRDQAQRYFPVLDSSPFILKNGVRHYDFNKNTQSIGGYAPLLATSQPRSHSLPTANELHFKRQHDIRALKEILAEKEREIWVLRQERNHQAPNYSPSPTYPMKAMSDHASPKAAHSQLPPIELSYATPPRPQLPWKAITPSQPPSAIQRPVQSNFSSQPQTFAPSQYPLPPPTGPYSYTQEPTPISAGTYPSVINPGPAPNYKPDTREPSLDAYADQERLSKEAFDANRQKSINNEMVSNLQIQVDARSNSIDQKRFDAQRKYYERMEHLHHLEEQKNQEEAQRRANQAKYKQDLQGQEQIRNGIQQNINRLETAGFDRGMDSLTYSQPKPFIPTNHLYMYGPNGAENPVRFAKSIPKTISYNPIVGTLHDTTVHWSPESYDRYTTAAGANLANQSPLDYAPAQANSPALVQPQYTKAHPFHHQSNPMGRPTAGPNIFQPRNQHGTSYSKYYQPYQLPSGVIRQSFS